MGHLVGQGRARALGRISRFAGHFQQAISNLEFLGLATGMVANLTLLLSLLHHQTAASVQNGVI
jgi:hypothetical protein